MFNKAITRVPCAEMTSGITTAELGVPDHALACRQHQAYVEALQHCGLTVFELQAEPAYPDSTFVEDTALLIAELAVVTRPGANSRRGEVESMRTELSRHFSQLQEISAPATLDAGDVMMVADHFFVGLSERSNQAGVEQLTSFLAEHGKTCSGVSMHEMLHLKTGVSYLENNLLLATGELLHCPQFQTFDIIEVPPAEAYAANSVWINDNVLVPTGNPKTEAAIKAVGYNTIALQVSEFRKLDGGLSCLSLRF